MPFIPTTVTVSPTPKHDQDKADNILALWMDNRDFLNQTMSGGTYASKSDIDYLRSTEDGRNIKYVKIRYNNLRDSILLDAKTWTQVTEDTVYELPTDDELM